MSRSRTNRDRAAGGFTLLEVLIAFVILASSYAVILQLYSGGLRSKEAANSRAAAMAIAEGQLALAEDGILAEGETRGEAGGIYQWRRAVVRWSAGDGVVPADAKEWLPVPYEVTVTVSWPSGRGQQELSLATLLLGAPR